MKSDILTLDDIKKKSRAAQSEVVELKTWGGSVRICPMSPGDADAYHQAHQNGMNFSGQVPVVFSCVVEPKFETEAQVADLGYAMVNEAFVAITGLGDKAADVEEAEKN